jgi:exosome complex RNA-binding protein Rrp42 (RNase PH superfamily)
MVAFVSEDATKSVLAAAEQGRRLDGRAFDELPTIHCRAACVAHANGSAEVRMGSAHVIAAVTVRVRRRNAVQPSSLLSAQVQMPAWLISTESTSPALSRDVPLRRRTLPLLYSTAQTRA